MGYRIAILLNLRGNALKLSTGQKENHEMRNRTTRTHRFISKSPPLSMSEKRSNTAAVAGSGVEVGGSHLERMPNSIINEILMKLEVETLCAVACASQTLRSSVSQTLSSLSSLDLSGFSPDVDTMNRIRRRFGNLKRVTLDCLRLDDSTVCNFLGSNVQELSLCKGSSLSSHVLASIGQNCPCLRELSLELAGCDFPVTFQKNLSQLLEGCPLMKSIRIKMRGTESDANGFTSICTLLPKTIKFLKLQPMVELDALRFMHECTPTDFGSPILTLKCLSLVLDIITDDLIIAVVDSLPLLVELDLEDRPYSQPSLPRDLSDWGLMSLSYCKHLTSLSLMRSRQNHNAQFKETSDMGMFLLSEGCKGLESIRLGGFCRVSDAGYASIFNSSQNLKKIEIRNAVLLSDLAFHNISKAPRCLAEVRLVSCNIITSESVEELASSSVLEVLDLLGCRSVADSCLGTISWRYALTSLNLGGADVTDSGMADLGRGNSPITYLCLRGCKRVTDKGIRHLLHGGGKISKTLSSLDIGHMPGISDLAILTIAADAPAITELCIRYCFYVTDASVKALASTDRRLQEGVGFLRKLDLHHCIGLSAESLELLKKPYFPGLRWIGVGLTRWTSKGNSALAQVREGRPLLTVCPDGCEMGCHDGWQFHKFDRL